MAYTSTTTPQLPFFNNHRNKNFHSNLSFTDFKPLSLPCKKPLLSSPPPQPPPPSRSSLQITRTATVEYARPAPDFDFNQEISRLKSLKSNLSKSTSLGEKHSVLDDDSRVKRFFSKNGVVFDKLDYRELYLLKCLVAAGQQHVVEVVEESLLHAVVEMIKKINGGSKSLRNEEVKDLKKLLKILGEMDRFYDCVGGVIGYQLMVLQLLAQSTTEKQNLNWSQHLQESMDCQFLEIHPPDVLDLSKNKEYASQAALWGIQGLPGLGEIYPLGGAADRLGLVDPDTGESLPAAMLPFCGRTLLEGLIRDLQAREFLYFKIYGKQCITPVAIMTSSAKNNHKRITDLCERMSWFGRGRSRFQLFEQPLVPAVSAMKGEWIVQKPFGPVYKPGGHGVIWKLAYDNGVFDWFYYHKRKGATVRQVSNVVAATDVTLLALAGIGLHKGKKLGFASCKRNSGATEGINALLEKKKVDGKWSYGMSCIEYTEFDKFGITSESEKSLQAEYPANTNILYVDLPSVEKVASSNSERCLPGMVLNTKKPITFTDNYGNRRSVLGGRLECTMQNIADNFSNIYASRCYQDLEDSLDTFIVYDKRRRVTSSAKKSRKQTNDSLHQTPDGALLDTLRNAYDLLTYCDIKLPEIEGNKKYVDSGPPFLVLLHPALGPLWEVTRQKFNGGSISEGSELQIEVSEFMWRNVQLDGSLIVVADNVMGSTIKDSNGEARLRYGIRCARCKLQNVKVTNKGIDWSFGGNIYWKHDVRRVEAVKVILHGNAEFEARNVVLQGNHLFEVPHGYKMKVTSGKSGLEVKLNPIEAHLMDSGTWYWSYKLDGTHIRLEYTEHSTDYFSHNVRLVNYGSPSLRVY